MDRQETGKNTVASKLGTDPQFDAISSYCNSRFYFLWHLPFLSQLRYVSFLPSASSALHVSGPVACYGLMSAFVVSPIGL
jgi:hypothetical protein